MAVIKAVSFIRVDSSLLPAARLGEKKKCGNWSNAALRKELSREEVFCVLVAAA